MSHSQIDPFPSLARALVHNLKRWLKPGSIGNKSRISQKLFWRVVSKTNIDRKVIFWVTVRLNLFLISSLSNCISISFLNGILKSENEKILPLSPLDFSLKNFLLKFSRFLYNKKSSLSTVFKKGLCWPHTLFLFFLQELELIFKVNLKIIVMIRANFCIQQLQQDHEYKFVK